MTIHWATLTPGAGWLRSAPSLNADSKAAAEALAENELIPLLRAYDVSAWTTPSNSPPVLVESAQMMAAGYYLLIDQTAINSMERGDLTNPLALIKDGRDRITDALERGFLVGSDGVDVEPTEDGGNPMFPEIVR